MATSIVARNLLSRQLQRRLPLAASSAIARPVALPSLGSYFGCHSQSFQRFFSSSDDEQVKSINAVDASAPSPPAVDYDVDDIMSTFEDTSYYDLLERHDYSHMTNEDLKKTSTIPGWDLIHSPPKDKETIPRGALVGTVVSTKMQKTVNVAVDRYKIHPKYRKRMRYTKKFMAHDDAEVANMGDMVMIVPCQRISKHKHFMLREIIRSKGQL
jgi:small subunit ribosomal protein S17